MPVKKLKEFLDKNKVKYVSIQHSVGYTAQEIAGLAHIPGREIAKVVIVKIDGQCAMAVLPATERVDLHMLKRVTGAQEVAIAHEEEFKDLFPECEVGAMPPFGNLFGTQVFVDKRLREDESIAFNAGTHSELIRMPYQVFEDLVRPAVVQIT